MSSVLLALKNYFLKVILTLNTFVFEKIIFHQCKALKMKFSISSKYGKRYDERTSGSKTGFPKKVSSKGGIVTMQKLMFTHKVMNK